jgi:hypothetical protein
LLAVVSGSDGFLKKLLKPRAVWDTWVVFQMELGVTSPWTRLKDSKRVARMSRIAIVIVVVMWQ